MPGRAAYTPDLRTEVIRMKSIPARATGAPQDSNFTRDATGLVRHVSMPDC